MLAMLLYELKADDIKRLGAGDAAARLTAGFIDATVYWMLAMLMLD
jgi:hypothetical protein